MLKKILDGFENYFFGYYKIEHYNKEKDFLEGYISNPKERKERLKENDSRLEKSIFLGNLVPDLTAICLLPYFCTGSIEAALVIVTTEILRCEYIKNFNFEKAESLREQVLARH